MVDEQIAKMLQRQRMKERKEEEAQKRKQEEALIDEKEIMEGIRNGECMVLDHKFVFEEKMILGDRVKCYLPCKELQIVSNFKEVFTAAENEYGVGIHFILSDEEKEKLQTWSVYKQNIQNNLKKSQMKFKWIEEGCFMNGELKLQYLEFISSTGLGTMHNYMWAAETKYGRLAANLNYDHDMDKYWKPVIRAMMKIMEIV